MNSKKIVTVIGSCRVHNPLKRLERNGFLTLNNVGFSDFCHTPREALQKLRIADGRFKLPKGLESLVIGRDEEPEIGRIINSDLVVIEISSVRRLYYKGCEIQLNFFLENIVRKNNLSEWFDALSKKARMAGQGNKVKHRLVSSNFPNEVVNLASNIEMMMESDDNIRNIMSIIVRDIKKPVLFVGHFNVYKEDHSKVADRERLNNCIRMAANHLNSIYCEPTALIELHGSKIALKDMNHWNDKFLNEAATFYYDKIFS